MPRLGLINMTIGFLGLFVAASGGTVLVQMLTRYFVHDPDHAQSWGTLLLKSAHGHVQMFAIIHILFGLTLPYSKFSVKTKTWQTAGFFSGIVAMGPLLWMKAAWPPSTTPSILDAIIGLFLSAALAALFTHAWGLYRKIR